MLIRQSEPSKSDLNGVKKLWVTRRLLVNREGAGHREPTSAGKEQCGEKGVNLVFRKRMSAMLGRNAISKEIQEKMLK